jgi:drug/metabolite transporter (DMT)-like permease
LEVMKKAGQLIGVAAALAAAVLWVMFLFANPYAPRAQGRALTFGGLMMLSALVSAAAALRAAHLGMYLLFLVSFFPVGGAARRGPRPVSPHRWVNLAYLTGAVLVHLSARRKPLNS